jgi:hypothetical protein
MRDFSIRDSPAMYFLVELVSAILLAFITHSRMIINNVVERVGNAIAARLN